MKPHFPHVLILSLACLSGSLHAQDNGLFSPVNRFALSYAYSDSLAAAVKGGGARFLSRPCDFRFQRGGGNVVIESGGMRAAAGAGLTAGGVSLEDIAGDRSAAGFGVLNGLLSLASPHLDAVVAFDLFTTDTVHSFFPVEQEYERFIAGTERPVAGATDFRPGVREAFLTARYRTLNVSAGQMKLRWGPGYRGTLGLSGTNYAPFYFYNVNLGIGGAVRLSSFLAGYGDEARFGDEVAAGDSLTVSANGRNIAQLPARYGAGQRVDVRLGRRVQLGLYELADFFGAGDLVRFASPLQLYYAANNASGTNFANLLAGADVNVVFAPWRFYGEVLNDDVTMFDDAGNPDKWAFMAGVQYFPERFVTHAGVEYTHVTRYTYGHYTALSRHTLWGECLGWPWGNFQESFAGHAVFRVTETLRGKVEAGLLLAGRPDLTADWYADSMPDLDDAPFWPEHSTDFVSFAVNAQWRPRPWAVLDATFRPLWREREPAHALYAFLTLTLPRQKRFELP